MHREVGAYLGTEIDETWWKRYRKDGFFARGSGEYWFENDGLYFRRYLTKKPVIIPFSGIKRMHLGKWHAGQWRMGKPILKIVWLKDGLLLSSGFYLAGSVEKTLKVKEAIERKRSSAVRGQDRP